ncbi:hypothetical protein M3Y99_01033500 [Aphelenchoides fujianensis]|nr:hypothetical protein M3Y99_01033500 [Aphelenchoides fujianensis]
MVAAEKKPRIRPIDGRDALTRFLLLQAHAANRLQTATQLLRLASISRAQSASVRRSVRRLEFLLGGVTQSLVLDLGDGTPSVELLVDHVAVRRIARLLRLPVHVSMGYMMRENWEQVDELLEFVEGLKTPYKDYSPAFAEFRDNVGPQLKELECAPEDLDRFPPLTLQKLVLSMTPVDYEELGRHSIHRLDVPFCEVERNDLGTPVLSDTIRSLGLVERFGLSEPEPAMIAAFCRRFPSLEELHVSIRSSRGQDQLDEQLKAHWTRCLEIRDALDAPDLKRIFFAVKHEVGGGFATSSHEWMPPLKASPPFDGATFTRDPLDGHERVLLVHRLEWPNGDKPACFRIEGHWRFRRVQPKAEGAESGGDSDGHPDEDDESSEEEEEKPFDEALWKKFMTTGAERLRGTVKWP